MYLFLIFSGFFHEKQGGLGLAWTDSVVTIEPLDTLSRPLGQGDGGGAGEDEDEHGKTRLERFFMNIALAPLG